MPYVVAFLVCLTPYLRLHQCWSVPWFYSSVLVKSKYMKMAKNTTRPAIWIILLAVVLNLSQKEIAEKRNTK